LATSDPWAHLGHREAPEVLGLDDVRQPAGDLLVGAEALDRAAPQPVLHAGFDHQGQVAVRQRLEAGDHRGGIGRLIGRVKPCCRTPSSTGASAP